MHKKLFSIFLLEVAHWKSHLKIGKEDKTAWWISKKDIKEAIDTLWKASLTAVAINMQNSILDNEKYTQEIFFYE